MSAPRYVVLKGDQVLAIGTAYQIAQELGVSIKTVKWWASPVAKKRADEGRHPYGRRVAERID